jgi:hypothetical protein
MIFYLGTRQTEWLERTEVPLFVSATRLRIRRRPVAVGVWALDSGAFTEIDKHGRWTIPAKQFADEVRQWSTSIGGMQWAAIMDWMCEPFATRKTGLSVVEHQRRTLASYQELTTLAPEIPWAPVIQGFRVGEYIDHVEQYYDAGLNLKALPVVGVGSVCRRQGTIEVVEIFQALYGLGLRNLHGFGLKTLGLPGCAQYLASADSMAWSYQARKQKIRLEGCVHQTCGNCIKWAIQWRRKIDRCIRCAEV